MLEKRTKSAAAEIAEADGDFDTIDDLARENSLLVYLTDKNGNIIYATDEYKSNYQYSEDHYSYKNGSSDKPYRKPQW